MAIIKVSHVSKRYPRHRGARALVGRGGIMDWLRGRTRETFAALDDVSLDVLAGESLGIIGRNGSGKSTLLKLMAGVTLPTSGEVTVRGRVASLLELGAGFHAILTGRENVYLNAGLLGMRHAQVDTVFDDIVAFSGIGEFIDQTVDTYSSGMYVRLAFATAVHANPDIFLVDEVLAVGDEDFQRRCRTRIGELRESGKTIVFVSHDLSVVNTLCDRIVLLDKGRMLIRDTPQQTIDFYLRQVGRASGIHTMTRGDLEVVFCEGRISVFHRGVEVSAPGGFRLRLECMGNLYDSTGADWKVDVREDHRCVARGVMARLPVTLEFALELDDRGISWGLSMTCQREAPVRAAEAVLTFPPTCDEWCYGDQTGNFPEIQPGDLEWATVVPPRPGVLNAGLAAPPSQALTPVLLHADGGAHPLKLHLANADYISGTRVLQVTRQFADTGSDIGADAVHLMALRVDLGLSHGDYERHIEERARERTIQADQLSARLRPGFAVLSHAGRELTTDVHLHTEFFAAGLWTFSQMMLWDAPERDGDTLRIRGESRRFPLRQLWEFEPAAEGLRFALHFEAEEALDIQEFNVSIGLVPQYSHWETSHETDAFPEDLKVEKTWTHVNKHYGVADFAEATGEGLPAAALRNLAPALPVHMTVLCSGSSGIRVLQAIRYPEGGAAFHFTPGTHRVFEGLVVVHE